MLRKRNRSFQKDQTMGVSEHNFLTDILSKKHDYNSFLKVPGLFVGMNTKYSESDSVRSPTSPLDFRIFSSRGNLFRHTISENEGIIKSRDCDKVGLSIVDSLDHGSMNLFGRQIAVKGYNSNAVSSELPKSLPEAQKSDSHVIFEIGEVADESITGSVDYGKQVSFPSSVQSDAGFIFSIPASEIELSEDYTCVTTHGPNPKVTHIFGDCIYEPNTESDVLSHVQLDGFLKFCQSCNKKLDGEDIYMYRGEKGFCSNTCRAEAMELDEDIDDTVVFVEKAN